MIDALIFGGTHLYMTAKAFGRQPHEHSSELGSRPVENPPSLEEVFVFSTILSGFAGATTSAITWSIAILVSVIAHTKRSEWWGPVHTGFLTGTILTSPIMILQVLNGTYSVIGTSISTYLVFSALFGLGMFLGVRPGYYRYDNVVVDPLKHLLGWDLSRYQTAGVPTSSNNQPPEWLYDDSEDEVPDIDTEAHLEELRVDPEDHPLKDAPDTDSETDTQNNSSGESNNPDCNSSDEQSSENSGGSDSESTSSEETKNNNSTVEDSPNAESDSKDKRKNEPDASDEEEMIEEFKTNWEDPPDTTFSDIGGYNEVKEALRSDIIQPLKSDNPGFERFDIEPDRGILLHGPPGTGKTLFARALANALDRPFVELDQAQLTSKWINESPQIIRRVFEEAQQVGGVIFIDEVENLVKDRGVGSSSHGEDDKVVTTFLTYLTKDDQNFIVIMTTNQKEMIDDAMLRPGRLDVKQEVGLPNKKARTEILKVNLEDIPHSLDRDTVTKIVEETEGWSGADIELLVNRAKRKAAEQNARALSDDNIRSVLSDVEKDVSKNM